MDISTLELGIVGFRQLFLLFNLNHRYTAHFASLSKYPQVSVKIEKVVLIKKRVEAQFAKNIWALPAPRLSNAVLWRISVLYPITYHLHKEKEGSEKYFLMSTL